MIVIDLTPEKVNLITPEKGAHQGMDDSQPTPTIVDDVLRKLRVQLQKFRVPEDREAMQSAIYISAITNDE